MDEMIENGSNANGGKKKRITLQDVAAKASVSVQTASHVLTGNMTVRIPDATRDRVKRAAKDVGYQPNRMAQAMKSGRTNIVAVWMPVDRVVPHHLEQLQCLGKVARDSGYELMVVGLEARVAYGTEWKLPSQWPVDGIISIDAGRALRRFRESTEDHTIPVCVLGNEDLPNGDSITWNLAGASADLAEEMIRAGATSLWHVTPNWVLENYPKEQRHTGFTMGCHKAGGKGHLVGVQSESVGDVLAAMDAAAEQHGPPQGITCFTDDIAVAAAWWLHQRGIALPKGCAVWGYGASPILDAIPFPVNSLKAPYGEMTAVAWEWLLDRIKNPDQPTRSRVFELIKQERQGLPQ